VPDYGIPPDRAEKLLVKIKPNVGRKRILTRQAGRELDFLAWEWCIGCLETEDEMLSEFPSTSPASFSLVKIKLHQMYPMNSITLVSLVVSVGGGGLCVEFSSIDFLCKYVCISMCAFNLIW
jgi:hypothetical protein